jgi:hypothetical protein
MSKKKTKDGAAPQPRTPGLWLDRDFNDAGEVNRAEADIKTTIGQWLNDPYYREAILRLKRKGYLKEALDDIGGNLPSKKGELASRYQWPKQKRSAGRPSFFKEATLRTLSGAFDQETARPLGKNSIKKFCKDISERASKNGVQVDTEKLYIALKNYRARNVGQD